MSEPKDELTPAEFESFQRALWAVDDASHDVQEAEGALKVAQGKLQQALVAMERIKTPLIRAYRLLPSDSLDPHLPLIKRGAR